MDEDDIRILKEHEKPIDFPALPGIGKRDEPTPRKPRDTCGECAHFQPNAKDLRQGACHGNPPSIAFTPEGPLNMRPGVNIRELACHLFKRSE